MKLWIMAQVKSDDGSVWELGGVFSSEGKAQAACVQPNDCVWPVELDEVLPRETVEVGRYPLAGGQERGGPDAPRFATGGIVRISHRPTGCDTGRFAVEAIKRYENRGKDDPGPEPQPA